MKIVHKISATVAILLSASLLYAVEPWGVLNEAVPTTVRPMYAVDFWIDNQPIRYAMDRELASKEKTIRQSLYRWPEVALQMINAQKRNEEFKDIIPLLKRKVKLTKVTVDKAPHIVFRMEKLTYKSGVVVSPTGDHSFALIKISSDVSNFKGTLLHEIGHFWGLADQYDSARFNSHNEHSSNVNTKQGSLMDNGSMNDLTCDDADGLINLFDLRLSQRNNGQFSARAQKGWKSLCAGSKNVYQNARTITRVDNSYAQEVNSWTWATYDKYTKGKLVYSAATWIDSPLLVFSVTPQDKVTRDDKNRITKVITKMEGTVLFPISQKNQSTELLWEKQFTYQYPTSTKSKNPTITINVTELLNGNKIHEQRFFASLQKELVSLRAPSFALSSTMLETETVTLNIHFSLENKKIKTFLMAWKDKPFVLKSSTKDTVAFSNDFGKTYTRYKLPLSPSAPAELVSMWKDYTVHYKALKSYYTNFYDVLFGIASPEKVSKQVTKNVKEKIK